MRQISREAVGLEIDVSDASYTWNVARRDRLGRETPMLYLGEENQTTPEG
jgi:hypothetical protein